MIQALYPDCRPCDTPDLPLFAPGQDQAPKALGIEYGFIGYAATEAVRGVAMAPSTR